MGAQIFPEQFYTKLLCNGERIGVTLDDKFEILPPETFCSRLKRFLTFQQDPYIDKVHSLFKTLVEQADVAEGQYFPILADEIHRHGQAKYRYLEANLIYLRKKLDDIGNLNFFSKLILKVVNTALTFFGQAPIQLKTYARHYEDNGLSYINRSFYFHWTSGNYINPLEREGLRLTEQDENDCTFSSDSPQNKREIQKLEKGLKDYHCIQQTYKDYNRPGMSTTQILANLEVSFDPKRQCFLAAINNPRGRSIYSPFNDLSNNPRIGPEKISPLFARHLRELPNDAKTFRYFVTATNGEGTATHHELAWLAQATEQAPFQLNQGSLPLTLEPNVQYRFYNEAHQEVGSFKITLNRL